MIKLKDTELFYIKKYFWIKNYVYWSYPIQEILVFIKDTYSLLSKKGKEKKNQVLS